MKKLLMLVLFLGFSQTSFAEVRYFNGKIERIEVCKSNGGAVFIYFKEIVGTAPTSTNGCSNDIALPFVWLNNTVGSITEFEKMALSTSLAAQASERSVRVRYDDQTWFLESIAID